MLIFYKISIIDLIIELILIIILRITKTKNNLNMNRYYHHIVDIYICNYILEEER